MSYTLTPKLDSTSTIKKKSRSDAPPLIGLSGKMRSGKTYSAKYLLKEYGFPYVSFAESLKEDLESLGVDPELLYDTKPEPVRRLMQYYGQTMRLQDPNHWLNRGLAIAHGLMSITPGVPIVFDDVRFKNEADAIIERGGIIIRLERLGQQIIDFDVSETDLDDYDYTHKIAVGEGDLEELEELLDDIMWCEGWLNG